MKIEFTIPLTKDLIVSEANRSNEHWTVKKKRHDIQGFLINSYFTKFTNISNDDSIDLIEIKLPCVIILTRIAPRELDFDNLVSSFKWIRDYVADRIIPGQARGRADGDKRLEWKYEQEKGMTKEYAVRVCLES